jgi:hypothetical protein
MPAPKSKVTQSKVTPQNIMGSGGPTLIPKMLYGSRTFVPATTNNNNTSGRRPGGGGRNVIIEGVSSLRYGELEQERRDAANTGGGGGGGAPAISIQSEPPKPQYIPPTLVKIPSRDVVDYQDADIPIELITNLLFENLGANELVKFERHDTVEGTNATYDIISNLAGIKKEFDPSNLISRQKVDTSYFDIYNIKLDTKIPDITYLFRNNLDNYVYIDTNGDLVIELDNMNEDELVEVQIDSSGTIYKVTL